LTGLVVALLCWGGYLAIDSRGYARCEGDYELASAHAAETAHQEYLAEVARGDAISRQLAQTQRSLNDVKTEYRAYSNGITGNCPADLGVLAHAAATGSSMPETAGTPANAAAPISAAAIGANLAENYARCLANEAQLQALIDWHRD
jgi:hypothetical protein